MNRWDRFIYYYKRILLSFIMLKCNDYSRCCYLFYSQLIYWEKEVPDLFNFIKSNYTTFDEEQWKISLSILARVTSVKPIHSDKNSMAKYYLMNPII